MTLEYTVPTENQAGQRVRHHQFEATTQTFILEAPNLTYHVAKIINEIIHCYLSFFLNISLFVTFLILQLKHSSYFPTFQLLKLWSHWFTFLVLWGCRLLSHVLPFAQGLGLYVPRFMVAFLDFDEPFRFVGETGGPLEWYILIVSLLKLSSPGGQYFLSFIFYFTFCFSWISNVNSACKCVLVALKSLICIFSSYLSTCINLLLFYE